MNLNHIIFFSFCFSLFVALVNVVLVYFMYRVSISLKTSVELDETREYLHGKSVDMQAKEHAMYEYIEQLEMNTKKEYDK